MVLPQLLAAADVMKKKVVPRSAFSLSVMRSMHGIQRISVRRCGSCINTEINKGESIRVFPISNWTEKDIWQYIKRENIDIVPLYFAAERPGRRA